MGLREYKRKRDFKATPEPAKGGERGGRIFVVQLHHASHRHFDFRLEIDGVLKSWAVPKGPSFDPKVKRLAVEVEDHPISYATFEGDIPKGHYGGGHVDIFDRGTWEPVGSAAGGLAKGELKFVLNGDVLRGSWVLVRTRKQGGKQQWLLIKHADGYAGSRDANDFVDPDTDRPIALGKRRKVWGKPHLSVRENEMAGKASAATRRAGSVTGVAERITGEAFAPELCKSQDSPPSGDEWLHEAKWDGYRILATIFNRKVRLWSRNGIEWTQRLPELVRALTGLGLKSAQLDGEMIVLRGGKDDFNALQSRLSAEIKDPIVYMLFDVLHRDGRSMRDLPLIDRKSVLKDLLQVHPDAVLRYSEHHIGEGATVFAQAVEGGLEGVVSKRIDSPYRGARTGAWVKSKGRLSDEFVVVGYTEPKRSRAGIGALLLGRYVEGKLVYAGRVGTGLDNVQLTSFRKSLERSIISKPPADIELMARKDRSLAIWVKPKLVVEVFYQGIGGQGLLRQPAFKALRTDKAVSDLLTPPGKVNTGDGRSKKAPSKASSATVPENAGLEVVITHPEREVFPATGITKGDVAAYYTHVAPWLLPEIAGRPLSVVRCPDGIRSACFFQKHVGQGWGAHIKGVSIREKSSVGKYLCINDVQGLLELVQMNVLEIHPWGARSENPELADRIVFDLDPHASVAWSRVVAGARDVRHQLESIGLTSFVRTSGGKGLHVVVPLNPPSPWVEVKAFAHGVAKAMSALNPDEYVSVAGEKNRTGKIFIDWLRNGRGATSIASYSLRARPTAGVSMPLSWEELGRVKAGDAFTLDNAVKRLKRRKSDPWASIDSVAQTIPSL
jgi:bifunctional non-homologous end joining protein LigD